MWLESDSNNDDDDNVALDQQTTLMLMSINNQNEIIATKIKNASVESNVLLTSLFLSNKYIYYLFSFLFFIYTVDHNELPDQKWIDRLWMDSMLPILSKVSFSQSKSVKKYY